MTGEASGLAEKVAGLYGVEALHSLVRFWRDHQLEGVFGKGTVSHILEIPHCIISLTVTHARFR